jgi:hypothetical protein
MKRGGEKGEGRWERGREREESKGEGEWKY